MHRRLSGSHCVTGSFHVFSKAALSVPRCLCIDNRQPMVALRRTHHLCRLVLLWFVLSLGYSTAGTIKPIVQVDADAQVLGASQMDCPLCVPGGASPPSAKVAATRASGAGNNACSLVYIDGILLPNPLGYGGAGRNRASRCAVWAVLCCLSGQLGGRGGRLRDAHPGRVRSAAEAHRSRWKFRRVQHPFVAVCRPA